MYGIYLGRDRGLEHSWLAILVAIAAVQQVRHIMGSNVRPYSGSFVLFVPRENERRGGAVWFWVARFV